MKSIFKQIELDERKIIAELKKNAKESIDKIAINCGFSRQKVWRIIKRLEENQTIWGYQVVTDDDMLGLKRYFVLIKRKKVPLTKELIDLAIKGKIKKEASKRGIIIECSFFLEGEYEGIFCVSVKDVRFLKIFVEILHKMLRGYVSDITVLEALFPIEKDGFDNPYPERIKEFIITE